MTDKKRLLSSPQSSVSETSLSGRTLGKGGASEYSSTAGGGASALVYQSQTSGNKRKWLCQTLSPRTKTALEVIFVSFAITLVIGLFAAIPIVKIISIRDNSNYICTSKSTQFNTSTTCDEISWSQASPSNNSPPSMVYTSGICKDFLHKWQECATGALGKVHVCPAEQQEKAGALVTEIVSFLDAAGSKVCQSTVLPFVCQYIFPLCGNSHQYLPSREECYHVSSVVCVREWELAEKEGLFDVPSCEFLPWQTHPENTSHEIPSIPLFNLSNTTCGQGFYADDNICLPRCDEFKQNSEQVSLRIRVVEIWTGWFGLISSIVVLVGSVIRYKSMFSFPSVFLVYMTISYSVVVLFVVITFFDQKGLYCRSHDLNYSIANPTVFCTVSGAVFHYCLVNGTLWWFFHVISIFYKLMFPFSAKRTEKYEKYIHAVLLAVGLILPLPAVMYVLIHSKYILGQFPPLLCVPKNGNLWYFSSVLVLNVLIAVGVCLFVPMFWIVHKHQGIFRTKKQSLPLTVAERKILFVLCYYALFGVISLVYFGITSLEQNNFIAALLEYFECNVFGENTECKPCFQDYTYPAIKSVCYLVMSCIPLANLVFVINWKKAGLLCDKLKAKAPPTKECNPSVNDDHSALAPHSESEIADHSNYSDYN